MRLENIYKNDINRNINGVIKVFQDDETSIKQELSEYVITRELRKHFATFLNNYEQSLSIPTDKIGVWISGFFGSGKSHFLKMLSFLLSNQIVDGKSAISYFEDKFDDPMMYAQLEQCASVPTETIIFNIDSKGPSDKDATVILRIFAKVFYEHQGFFGTDLKVAKLEKFITSQGKMDEFKRTFEEINGDTWENSRDAFSFWEDDIVEVLQSVVGMSETAARNWFNGTETADLSIEQLVSEIKEYIDSKGNDQRLLFMIDEVGQYIGSEGSLMLNLQTIVEEIGSKCGGRVWVMVTSQEAIDSITKISGDDFSKIQGRFNTRLSLSSSSVDEVIKKRILEKTDIANDMLRMNYGQNSAVLRNLFTFNDAVMDLKGYEGEFDYVETYPFVPYQFRLMQNVLAQVRKHGNSGKHLSGGERSMISGFQEAAQAIEDKDENALVPFSLFYDTINTFLEGTIRRVIDRCQMAADNHDGIEQYDVEILKLLYLIRYVDDIKANVENITTLMVEKIDADKITMRQIVQASLDRLQKENYIARNGDTYAFLTDDEQDIAMDIRKTIVNGPEVIDKIRDIIFGNLYMSKKIKYDKYDFPYDQFVDNNSPNNITGGMILRIVTIASDLASGNEQRLLMNSANNEAIIQLSTEYPYYDEIESAMKIRKYVKSRNVTQLPEVIQSIIRGRQQQASQYEKNAKELIEKAIVDANFYVHGDHLTIKSGTPKDKIDTAMHYLIEGVYGKLGLIKKFYSDDQDILNTLKSDPQTKMGGIVSPNEEAAAEIMQYMDMQKEKHLPTTMGDVQKRFSNIPYGWREIDIAGVVAELIADQKLSINYSGSVIQPTDRKIVDYLRKKSEIDKTIVAKRVVIDSLLVDKSRKLLKEYFPNILDVPSKEDDLIGFVISRFENQKDELKLMLQQYSNGNYPDKQVLENGIALLDALLLQKKDNVALLNKLVSIKEDLLDLSEDLIDVQAFFKNQRPIFDKADDIYRGLNKEKTYFDVDTKMLNDLQTVHQILSMPKPYRRINELPTLIQSLQDAYQVLLDAKAQDVLMEIQSAMAEIHQTAKQDQKDTVIKADSEFASKIDLVHRTNTMTELDAMRIQLGNIKQKYLKALIVKSVSPDIKSATTNRTSLCYATNLKTEEDVDAYLADLKEKLMGLLDGKDILHII